MLMMLQKLFYMYMALSSTTKVIIVSITFTMLCVMFLFVIKKRIKIRRHDDVTKQLSKITRMFYYGVISLISVVVVTVITDIGTVTYENSAPQIVSGSYPDQVYDSQGIANVRLDNIEEAIFFKKYNRKISREFNRDVKAIGMVEKGLHTINSDVPFVDGCARILDSRCSGLVMTMHYNGKSEYVQDLYDYINTTSADIVSILDGDFEYVDDKDRIEIDWEIDGFIGRVARITYDYDGSAMVFANAEYHEIMLDSQNMTQRLVDVLAEHRKKIKQQNEFRREAETQREIENIEYEKKSVKEYRPDLPNIYYESKEEEERKTTYAEVYDNRTINFYAYSVDDDYPQYDIERDVLFYPNVLQVFMYDGITEEILQGVEDKLDGIVVGRWSNRIQVKFDADTIDALEVKIDEIIEIPSEGDNISADYYEFGDSVKFY